MSPTSTFSNCAISSKRHLRMRRPIGDMLSSSGTLSAAPVKRWFECPNFMKQEGAATLAQALLPKENG